MNNCKPSDTHKFLGREYTIGHGDAPFCAPKKDMVLSLALIVCILAHKSKCLLGRKSKNTQKRLPLRGKNSDIGCNGHFTNCGSPLLFILFMLLWLDASALNVTPLPESFPLGKNQLAYFSANRLECILSG
jgi:hypothetical protein